MYVTRMIPLASLFLPWPCSPLFPCRTEPPESRQAQGKGGGDVDASNDSRTLIAKSFFVKGF